ncbi:MAG: ABC transporter ATP-binding protein, partial [Candidatus Deferrimicrobium sp.]
MKHIVEVFGLTKRFKPQRGVKDFLKGNPPAEITAVDNVSFGLEEGEVFGLLGPNGAGKTTLINLLCTLLIPTSGTARLGDIDVVRDPAGIRKLVGLVTSNERSFYWRLTGLQNLRFFSDLYRVPIPGLGEWISELLEALDVSAYADRRFDSYSTGIRQRFAFARALLHRPRIIFMDEPTKGLDPVAAVDLVRLIGERILRMWGPTIIITSHNLVEIERLCGRVAIMDGGKLLKCGSIEMLRKSFSA